MRAAAQAELGARRDRLKDRPDVDHSAETHKWVVRTAAGDEMAATTRWSTSWPLLWMYSVRQVRLRYRQSIVGVAWTLVQPVAIMAIYGFVFTAFLDVGGGEYPYLAMAWTGLTVWMYVQATVQMGTVSMLNDAYMIGKVWFPREIIPLAPVVGGLVDLGMAALVLVGIVVVQGGAVGWSLVSLPLVFYTLFVWVSAISVLAGTITVFFRDLTTIVALGLRLMFIATPVMYPSSVVPSEFRWLNLANPFAVVIESVRHVFLLGDWPGVELLCAHALVGTVLFAFGIWYLRKVDRRMIDVI